MTPDKIAQLRKLCEAFRRWRLHVVAEAAAEALPAALDELENLRSRAEEAERLLEPIMRERTSFKVQNETEREVRAITAAEKERALARVGKLIEKCDTMEKDNERLKEGLEKIIFLSAEPDVGDEERLEGITLACHNLIAGKRWDESVQSAGPGR